MNVYIVDYFMNVFDRTGFRYELLKGYTKKSYYDNAMPNDDVEILLKGYYYDGKMSYKKKYIFTKKPTKKQLDNCLLEYCNDLINERIADINKYELYIKASKSDIKNFKKIRREIFGEDIVK